MKRIERERERLQRGSTRAWKPSQGEQAVGFPSRASGDSAPRKIHLVLKRVAFVLGSQSLFVSWTRSRTRIWQVNIQP